MENRVIVFLNHGLGDLIMSLPFLRKLIDVFFESEIDIIVKSNTEKELLNICKISLNENVNIFVMQNSRKYTFLSHLLRTKYNFYFAPQASSSFKYLLLNLVINATNSFGPSGKFDFCYTNTFDNSKKDHKINYFLKYLSSFESSERYTHFIDFNLANQITGKKYVIIAPGSGEIEKHKRIPIETLNKFIKIVLEKYDIDFVILGTKSEADLLESLNFHPRTKVVKVSSLIDSFNIIKKSIACITPCNGTSHIASALDIPILGVYGPTNPGFTGAFSKKMVTLRKNLSCSPCYNSKNIKGCGNNICMYSITETELLFAFEKLVHGFYDKEYLWCELKSGNGK
jgi:ADP-heptose:LPS heptosyltransferase